MASAPRSGPLAALRRVVMTLLAMGEARLQLIGNEVQIEKHRALQQLVRVLLATFCACMALVLGVGLLLVLLWDQRVALLATLIVVFLGIALWLVHALKQTAASQEHPFAASIAELQEDLRQLKASASHDAAQEPR